MKLEFVPLPTFMREAKRLNKRYHSLPDDLADLQQALLANPALGVDLGGVFGRYGCASHRKDAGKAAAQELSPLPLWLPLMRLSSTCFISMTNLSAEISRRKKSTHC